MADTANSIPQNWRDWYRPEEAEPAAPVAAQAGAVPESWKSWYTPDVEAAAAPTEQGSDLADVGRNVATGLARVPGAIIGAPAAINHALNWLTAKGGNAITGGNVTATQLDNTDPIARALPTSQGVDNAVFKATGTTPYEPTSPLGKLGQAAVTGAGAGLLDPMALTGALKGAGGAGEALLNLFKANAGNAAKTALASSAAEGTHEVFPNSDILPVAAAVLTHGGAELATDATRTGYGLVRPIVNPTGSAKTTAARVLANVDHSLPGLANPDDAAIQGAIDNTKSATDALGDGLDDYTAGGNMRADLQGRKDALLDARTDATSAAYTKFRNEPPLEAAKLAPFTGRPAFDAAVKAASGGVRNAGEQPLTDLLDFNEAGDPVFRPGAAVPPDVLDRIKGHLDDAVEGASNTPRAQRDLTILRDSYRTFLDKQFPDTYPQARGDFAAASRPLDPLTQGPVGKVLDSQTSFGNRNYTMPQDRIADTFLKSRALRSDFDSLVAGYGGNKNAALSNLRENLVAKVKDAVNPDGTLSQDAFDRSVRPYTKALSMWFPDLSKQFNTAKGAQGALDNMRAQEGIAADVKDGGLRDSMGLVTQGSFSSWLDRNGKALGKTQDPSAIMRLKQIAAALPRAPGAGAEAVVEGLPAAVGYAAGGSESGIFGAMFHKIPDWITGPRMQTFKDAYSQTIEAAATNPASAKRLVAEMNARPRSQTATQALGQIVLKQAKAAAAAAPVALNASRVPNAQ